MRPLCYILTTGAANVAKGHREKVVGYNVTRRATYVESTDVERLESAGEQLGGDAV